MSIPPSVKRFQIFPFIYLGFSLLPTVIFAQHLPEILSTRAFKRGVYQTFQEFLINSPSITVNFRIEPASGDRKIAKGLANYRLVFEDSVFARKERRKFWGVCDGESIYVNELQYSDKFFFRKIHGLGRYCYLMGSPPYSPMPVIPAGAIAGGVAAAAMAATAGDILYILNVNNAKFYALDKKLLRIILEDDKELSQQYEREDHPAREETLIAFVKKYNERHAHEAYRGAGDPKEIIVYRRSKREVPDTFSVRLNDTISLQMTPDSFYKIEVSSDSLDICVNEQCQKIPLQKKKPNYVYCLWPRNADAPEAGPVPEKEGVFYVKEIERKASKK